MNITLIYENSKYNVDVLDDTPCQYLYSVVNKIFRIPISQIKLTYEDIEIENNSRLLFSVMGKTDRDNIKGNEEIIVERKNNFVRQKSLMNLNNNSLRKAKSKYNMLNYLEESTKLPLIKGKKKGFCVMKCQICNLKNSIFYCRVCNLFVCFECNVRFNEHKNHERINLEDGDSFLGCEVYREELVNEINVIELGFQQTLEWMIENQEREEFLQSLFKSLEQIRNYSLNLSDTKTLYNLDQEKINDFRIEIDKIPQPKHQEEIIEIFGNLNLKENELRNYTKFLNLQIIKTEYNKVLLKCLDKVKTNIDKLGNEVKSRLTECEEIKFRNIEDIKLYLKESKLEKNQMDIKNYLSKDFIDNNNNANGINNNCGKNTLKEMINHTAKKEGRNNNFLKEKEMSKTEDKKMKPFILKGDLDNIKTKLKIKELNITNNYSTSNIKKKKRELLIPLKINKRKEIRTGLINEVNNIEKPKNIIKKNYFNTRQKLSEADFKDFPFSSIKKDNDKKEETTSKDESEDKEIDLPSEKNIINPLQNIDLSRFIGTEKKLLFKAPPNIKDNRSIFKRRKIIFEKKE